MKKTILHLLLGSLTLLGTVSCHKDNETTEGKLSPMERWVGTWRVQRKNGNVDVIDKWEISVKEKDKTLRIIGLEGFTDLTRYDTEATVDENGDLIVRTQITGSYEDANKGHVDLLLSGQYLDSVTGKFFYTSNIGVILMTGKLSEDGNSASLNPGDIKETQFKNFQFYGRYMQASGNMSGASFTAGPTTLPNTLTRVLPIGNY